MRRLLLLSPLLALAAGCGSDENRLDWDRFDRRRGDRDRDRDRDRDGDRDERRRGSRRRGEED